MKLDAFQHFFVLLVFRISDGVEIIGVARRSTAIFWWASSLTFEAQRGFRLRVDGREALEQYFVPLPLANPIPRCAASLA
jgi:hypothetical protein